MNQTDEHPQETTMTLRQRFAETTPALNVKGPISRDAVAIRLDPLNWPEELKRDDLAGPSAMARAIDEAGETFSQFEAVRETYYRDPKLTTAGAYAATTEWAAP